MPTEYAQQIATIFERTGTLVTEITEIKTELQAMNGRQRKDHDDVTTLKTRVNQWAAAQALWTTTVGIVVGIFGTQK